MKIFQCFDRNVTRISRFDYWISWFATLLFFSFLDVLLFCSWQTFGMDKLFLGIFCVTELLQFVYLYFLTLKRFHDVGYATWCLNVCILLSLVFIGSFLILLVTLKESDRDNAWGGIAGKN